MTEEVNIGAYLGVLYGILLLISIIMVVFYAEPGFPWHTYLTCVIGYFSSFAILLLAPIDIATIVADRSSTAFISEQYASDMLILKGAYQTFFYILLIFGNFLLVFEEYYNTDGYFTIGGKLADAFYRMCKDMVIMVVAGLILLGILIGEKVVPGDSDALTLTSVIITNTVYETFLVCLLAYGLVEYPRSLWYASNRDYYLLLTQMRATSDYKDISDYKISIQEEISKVMYFRDMILTGKGDEQMLKALETLQEDCPSEFRSQRKCTPDEAKKYLTRSGQITIAGLAQLRGDLNLNKDRYKMAQAKVLMTQNLAYYLEDLIEARKNGSRVIKWSMSGRDSTEGEYVWHTERKPLLLKVGSVVCGVLSIFSLLGVVCSMAGVSNDTSVYFLIVHNSTSPAGVVVFILITLGYTTYVTLWALFQIRVAGVMELVPYRTSPEGVSFNVRMCARLAAPLVFFYLGWISENGLREGSWQYNQAPSITVMENVTKTFIHKNVSHHVTYNHSHPILQNVTYFYNTSAIVLGPVSYGPQQMTSAFSRFYQLQSVAIIKNTFGTLFPVILFILLPLFATNAFNRALLAVGLGKYQFGAVIPTEEQLREGTRQLAKFKKIAERGGQRLAMRNHILNIGRERKEGEEEKDGGGGILRGILLTIFGRNAEPDLPQLDLEAANKRVLVEPPALASTLEKKVSSSMGMGSTWKEMYAEVRAPCNLCFFKDKKAAKGGGEAVQTIDVKVISNLTVPSKKNKESVQLDIEVAGDAVKIRLKSQEECERWKDLLKQWKDYANDFADLYPTGSPGDNLHLEDLSSFGASDEDSKGKGKDKQGKAKKGGKDKEKSLESYVKDLDDVVVEMDADAYEGGKEGGSKGKSGWGSMFGSGSKSKSPDVEKRVADAASADDDERPEKPKVLEGWLEKKGTGALKKLGNEWQKRYFRIDEKTCSLNYYKTKSAGDEVKGSLDLRTAGEITASSSDASRFTIDMGDRLYKLRAGSASEGTKWVNGLNAWKEYLLMKMD